METLKDLGSKALNLINPMKEDIKNAVSTNPNVECKQICSNSGYGENKDCPSTCENEKQILIQTQKFKTALSNSEQS